MEIIKKILEKTTIDEKLVETSKTIKKQYRKNLVTGVNAGLGFLIALYIRDFLKTIISLILIKLNLVNTTGIIYNLIITLVVIAVCVFGIIFMSKWQVEK